MNRRSFLRNAVLSTAAAALGLEVVAPEPHRKLWQVSRRAPLFGTSHPDYESFAAELMQPYRNVRFTNVMAPERSFEERLRMLEDMQLDGIDRETIEHVLGAGMPYDPAWDMPVLASETRPLLRPRFEVIATNPDEQPEMVQLRVPEYRAPLLRRVGSREIGAPAATFRLGDWSQGEQLRVTDAMLEMNTPIHTAIITGITPGAKG